MACRFDPQGPIVQLCIESMRLQAEDRLEEARVRLEEALSQADEYGSFLLCNRLAELAEASELALDLRLQALSHARRVGDEDVRSAYSTLAERIADALESDGRGALAASYRAFAASARALVADRGPFYHGTRAVLAPGDELVAGRLSNYQEGLVMNHVYFTANERGAWLAAALAQGSGIPRVYEVAPTGPYEADPNVTDVRFPGNLTRSYRSMEPLRILREVSDRGASLSTDDELRWRRDVREGSGSIVN